MFAKRSLAALPVDCVPEAEVVARVHVSRQPVLDSMERVTGYRIAYAEPTQEQFGETSRRDAMALFDTVLSVIGLERVVGDAPAHLPISEQMLLALGTPPIRPDRLLLRIHYQDAINPQLDPMLDAIAERGYTMELDQLPGPDFDMSLLERFAIVEIDPSAWEPAAVEAVAHEITARGRTPLAAGLPDYAAREAAFALGFKWFTGPFFGTPKVIKGRDIPTGNLRGLASMLSLQGADISLEQVVDVINHDIGLSVKLLRYINSAYFGLAAKVSSIRAAAMRLGSQGVARWALTITVTSAPGLTPEVATLALTRARLCELLAPDDKLDSGELFTIGLLSAADGIFNRPLATIVPELPLTDSVADALLHKTGPMGEVLRMVLAYERGDFGSSLLDKFGLGHARSYRNALNWAQETLVQEA